MFLAVGGPEGEVQHDRRHHNQSEQPGGDDRQSAVALLEGDVDLQPDAAGQAHGALGDVRRVGRADPHPPQLVQGAEDGAVTAVHRVVAPRAGRHRRVAGGHDRHRCQVAEMAAEGVVRGGCPLDTELDDGEVDPGQLNGVRRPSQAGLDEGGSRQRCHVQHAARPGDPLERLRHRRVGQLDDERQLRPDLLDAQRRLERVDLVDLDAHHRGGPCQAGLLEPLAPMGVSANMGTPQSSRIRENRGSVSSSITTTWVPLRWNCSTARNPTPWRPHTIT